MTKFLLNAIFLMFKMLLMLFLSHCRLTLTGERLVLGGIASASDSPAEINSKLSHFESQTQTRYES